MSNGRSSSSFLSEKELLDPIVPSHLAFLYLKSSRACPKIRKGGWEKIFQFFHTGRVGTVRQRRKSIFAMVWGQAALSFVFLFLIRSVRGQRLDGWLFVGMVVRRMSEAGLLNQFIQLKEEFDVGFGLAEFIEEHFHRFDLRHTG